MVLLMEMLHIRNINTISMVTHFIVIDLRILIVNALIDGDVACLHYQCYFDALDDTE